MPADLNDYFNKKNSNSNSNSNRNFNFKAPDLNFKGFSKLSPWLTIVFIIIVLLAVAKPFAIVNSGEMGIKVTTGEFSSEPLRPGLHFFIPILQKIIVVDTKVRQMTYASVEGVNESSLQRGSGVINKSSISVLDSRGLSVSIDVTVQYSLNENVVPQTIATWNVNWEDKIIDPTVRDVVRSVVGKYTAEELPANRNAIAQQINEDIGRTIAALPNHPVTLNSVQLREIVLPTGVKQQIELVQIAKQEAERAAQEAIKKATLAEGEANATIISSRGRADAARIEADAQAYANKEIAQSLNNPLLNLRQIETQKAFNDALKVNNDAKIFLTPGGAVPNIWVDTKDTKRQSAINSN
ncbi:MULTISPECIES: prohibitin family protein [unclassified Campylobacter]|uniref:prohibitin family protein n=1 Tax=unclassified Campylobacter TaxID=2593542 RepID=UPI001237CAE9|nr:MULTISPECIES: prohibitin family protein [unclassified Campylobacter]KAA6225175.1 prohibitin family protein [Campylobacter sp. LR196d]KAA6226187.1 prohibitin family protein [Campylobacter sp. LR185c]KAA6229013.1 prohibitin family protein [Campylobacter sp. LR286c]KAA6231388.1 prohibitin family protein [Campylobacter sp. LR264d]KAA6231600.1 prohibitin family protein [Campylobacter sp. LR291e]